MKQLFLYKFRGWLFERMVDAFVNSGWIIKIIDFRNQEVKKYKDKVGLTVFNSKIIYLDVREGAPRILLHELGHFSFRDFFTTAAQDLPWKEMAGLRDILIHHYFGVDLELTYEVVINDLKPIKEKIAVILNQLRSQ